MFRRPDRFTFLQSRRDLATIYSRATVRAGPDGTDSLDLLLAALEARQVASAMRRLGVDPAALAAAANEAHENRQPGPGLTGDAKRVVEAVSRRALERGRDPSGLDLLLGLAVADAAARQVLNGFGIDEARVQAVVE
jgi:hypothetical protein